MKPTAQNAGIVHKKAGFLKTFKKNLPLTLMALPALIIMFLFRYLPMAACCWPSSGSAFARGSSQ